MTPRTLAYIGAGIMGALLAAAAGLIAVYRLFGLSAELIGASVTLAGIVLAALGLVVKAYADRIVAMLKVNDQKTEQAVAAAQNAETHAASAANHAAERAALVEENQQLRTALKNEREAHLITKGMWKHAYDTLRWFGSQEDAAPILQRFEDKRQGQVRPGDFERLAARIATETALTAAAPDAAPAERHEEPTP